MKEERRVLLKHPNYGIIDCKKNDGPITYAKIVDGWKKKYGKKFNECIVEKIEPKKKQEDMDILFVPTKEVFSSVKEAHLSTGWHPETIRYHLRGNIVDKRYLKFKYIKKPLD